MYILFIILLDIIPFYFEASNDDVVLEGIGHM